MPTNKSPTLKPEVCLSISVKLYGLMHITEPRSDAACETALSLLKAKLIVAKTHKPRATVELLPDKFAIKRSNMVTCMFAYQDMAYIWSDPADSRTCGLVFRRSSDEHFWYEFHGYKLERGPSRLVGALKYVFLSLPSEGQLDIKRQQSWTKFDDPFDLTTNSSKSVNHQSVRHNKIDDPFTIGQEQFNNRQQQQPQLLAMSLKAYFRYDFYLLVSLSNWILRLTLIGLHAHIDAFFGAG
ncbi:hypothetical protein FBUS_06743 [Fasciolopsis buskii]|uniref:Uncharacterized protein n=1 Tax=Fasciolopsis buskii TaxID=27845 RepID=A0A8E0S2I8_9TREM|nr:hypothetical protein FBUS_06743 [Fasciolopsis buski]